MVRDMLRRDPFAPGEVLSWLKKTLDSNERASRSHTKCRAALRASQDIRP